MICLGAACMLSLLVGACWDELLYLLQGNVSDKVRVSDQPDVVSSLTEWFVGFSLNSCFPFLIRSETLKQQPGGFGSSAPRSQSCCWWPVQWLSGACRSFHLADPKTCAGRAL